MYLKVQTAIFFVASSFSGLAIGVLAYGDTCSESFLQPFDVHNATAQIQAHRKVILEGYRLPTSYTEPYYARRIEPYLQKPNFPSIPEPTSLYRGLFISIDQLLALLSEGMKIEKVNWTAFVGKNISYSSSIQEAATYIFKNADSRAEAIGVVVQVKMSKKMTPLKDPVHNPTQTIFFSSQNQSPEELSKIYIWGEYGLESFSEVLQKIELKKIKPHTEWPQFSGR